MPTKLMLSWFLCNAKKSIFELGKKLVIFYYSIYFRGFIFTIIGKNPPVCVNNAPPSYHELHPRMSI